jgi:hypothetical protein
VLHRHALSSQLLVGFAQLIFALVPASLHLLKRLLLEVFRNKLLVSRVERLKLHSLCSVLRELTHLCLVLVLVRFDVLGGLGRAARVGSSAPSAAAFDNNRLRCLDRLFNLFLLLAVILPGIVLSRLMVPVSVVLN